MELVFVTIAMPHQSDLNFFGSDLLSGIIHESNKHGLIRPKRPNA